MVKADYIPDKGDLVWLEFNPQAGHEQKGHRPAICVSPRLYNQKTGLGLFCPVTSKIKGYPFEVVLQEHSIEGCILSDQIKNLDFVQRNCCFIEKASSEEIGAVLENLQLQLTN